MQDSSTTPEEEDDLGDPAAAMRRPNRSMACAEWLSAVAAVKGLKRESAIVALEANAREAFRIMAEKNGSASSAASGGDGDDEEAAGEAAVTPSVSWPDLLDLVIEHMSSPEIQTDVKLLRYVLVIKLIPMHRVVRMHNFTAMTASSVPSSTPAARPSRR